MAGSEAPALRKPPVTATPIRLPPPRQSPTLLHCYSKAFKRHRQGTVLYFTHEDHAAWVVKPRAIAAGIDLDRLIVVPDALTFADLGAIRGHIEAHDVKMVYFDTLQKYVQNPNADMNSNFGSQGQLAPVEGLAAEAGVAVVVTRHLRKGNVADASEAGSGSQAIAGAMRAVLTCGELVKGGDEFGLALAVGNYTRRRGGIVYRMESSSVQVSDGMVDAVYVKVLREDSTLDADSLTNGGGGGRQKTDAEEGEEWFRCEYARETKAYSDNMQAACKDEDALFKYATLKKVLRKLGWKAGNREGDGSGKVGGNRSFWVAPDGWCAGAPEIENELLYQPSESGLYFEGGTVIRKLPKMVPVKLRMGRMGRPVANTKTPRLGGHG